MAGIVPRTAVYRGRRVTRYIRPPARFIDQAFSTSMLFLPLVPKFPIIINRRCGVSNKCVLSANRTVICCDQPTHTHTQTLSLFGPSTPGPTFLDATMSCQSEIFTHEPMSCKGNQSRTECSTLRDYVPVHPPPFDVRFLERRPTPNFRLPNRRTANSLDVSSGTMVRKGYLRDYCRVGNKG